MCILVQKREYYVVSPGSQKAGFSLRKCRLFLFTKAVPEDRKPLPEIAFQRPAIGHRPGGKFE